MVRDSELQTVAPKKRPCRPQSHIVLDDARVRSSRQSKKGLETTFLNDVINENNCLASSSLGATDLLRTEHDCAVGS
jgi:hypothetical protein